MKAFREEEKRLLHKESKDFDECDEIDVYQCTKQELLLIKQLNIAKITDYLQSYFKIKQKAYKI